MKGILHCVGWCSYCGDQDRYCAGVHSSMVELTSLEIPPFHLFSILINPNVVLAWLDFDMSLDMCELASVSLFLMGMIPSSGVTVLLID